MQQRLDISQWVLREAWSSTVNVSLVGPSPGRPCTAATSGYGRTAPGYENAGRPVLPPIPTRSAAFLSPDDFERALQTPAVAPTEEGIRAMQLPHLFEGDIAGIPVDNGVVQFDNADVFRQPLNSALNLVTFPDKLWPNGRIPYTLEEELNEQERMVVAQALQEYKEKTCIRFIPKDEYDYDYVHIRKNRDLGCSSYVGRAGGNQTVSLEVDKCFSKGIVAHELMHVLGFFHEHSRTDRDKYVRIVDENILPGMLRNFEKYPHKIMDTLEMPYDYGSVMHYHKLAFSRNGKPTIVPYEAGAEIGQRIRLSEIDAAKVNKLYNCQDYVSTWISTTTKPGQPDTTTVAPTSPTTSIRPYTEDRNVTLPTTTNTPTSTSTSSSPAPGTRLEKKCQDLNDHCKMWADLGHCKWSEKYMTSYCREACDLCHTPDLTSTPSSASGNVQSNGTSKECLDQNLFCGYWAKIGECEREAKFMRMFCKRSCGGCTQRLWDPSDNEDVQKRKKREKQVIFRLYR